jgi:hypothetical protein
MWDQDRAGQKDFGRQSANCQAERQLAVWQNLAKYIYAVLWLPWVCLSSGKTKNRITTKKRIFWPSTEGCSLNRVLKLYCHWEIPFENFVHTTSSWSNIGGKKPGSVAHSCWNLPVPLSFSAIFQTNCRHGTQPPAKWQPAIANHERYVRVAPQGLSASMRTSPKPHWFYERYRNSDPVLKYHFEGLPHSPTTVPTIISRCCSRSKSSPKVILFVCKWLRECHCKLLYQAPIDCLSQYNAPQ